MFNTYFYKKPGAHGKRWARVSFLVFLGICYVVICFIKTTTTTRNNVYFGKRKRSLESHAREHVHLTARDVLDFPRDYHAKGVLSLPYGNIVEPFEAWFSAEHKMSRIDYYGGMDQTYQREGLGKYGFACKVVPEYSEISQKTYRGCLHRRGTKKFPVKAQSIVPAPDYFKYTGDVILRGHNSAKWEHKFKVFNKLNTYVLYTTKTKPLRPLKYEMLGYDTLLSSYYDHYILYYEIFEPWTFNYSTLQIPTDLDCFDFSSKKFTNVVGELNPMLEFMPHTSNGAPFTFSHGSRNYASFLSQEKRISYANADLNRNFVDASALFSTEDAMKQEHSQLNYPDFDENLTTSKRLSIYPQQGVTRQTGLRSSFVNNQTLVSLKTISDFEKKKMLSAKKNDIYPLQSLTAKQKSLFRASLVNNENHGSQLRRVSFKFKPQQGVGKSISLRKYKLFRKNKRKKNKELSRFKTTTRDGFLTNFQRNKKKRTRIRKIFNAKTTQGKLRKWRKKSLSAENTIGWKKSFKVDEVLPRNYEEIVDELFDAFKIAHEKKYLSKHEHESRKNIYRHNFRFIQSRNRMHLGYKLRSNHLMDVTDKEMHRHKGLLNDQSENVSNGGVPFQALSDKVPASVDWRETGAVNSVRSQGICGSCYAYSVTGALEGAYFLKTGHLPDFSEQEIIDCSWGFGNRGCKGGYPHRAMQWILKHGGLAKERSYGKYLAQEGYCHFKNVSIGVRVDSYMNTSKGNVTELKQALAQYGPVSVLINTKPKSFKFYSSGVYYDPECSASSLDHAALAVGYGEERGVPYWLVKNSWSKAWGDQGYIKIAQRNNNCGVASKAVVVRIK